MQKEYIKNDIQDIKRREKIYNINKFLSILDYQIDSIF